MAIAELAAVTIWTTKLSHYLCIFLKKELSSAGFYTKLSAIKVPSNNVFTTMYKNKLLIYLIKVFKKLSFAVVYTYKHLPQRGQQAIFFSHNKYGKLLDLSGTRSFLLRCRQYLYFPQLRQASFSHY